MNAKLTHSRWAWQQPRKLLGQSLAALLLLLLGGTASAQYCTTSLYTSSCTSNDYINGFSTSGGVANISNLNSGCNGAPNNYTYFTTTSASGIAGVTTLNFTINNNPSYGQGYKIWVDWDQSGTFDVATEEIYASATTIPAGGSATGSFLVPAGANIGTTRLRVRCVYASTSFTPCSQVTYGEVEDYDFTVIAATPCAGQPVAGTITPASPVTVCAGNTLNLSSTGTTAAGNLSYQWQTSTDAGATWTNASGTSTNFGYLTPVLSDTVWYRFVVNCDPSGLSDTSDPVVINVGAPPYYAIPYTQDFEAWQNFCATKDVPDENWLNNPATGGNSWRRYDEGSTAGWAATWGGYTPQSFMGSYSARFSVNSANGSGTINMLLDCSTSPGVNELSFAYIMGYNWYNDSLIVRLSTDGGATYTNLAAYTPGFSGPTWTPATINFTSSSANTIIQFVAKEDQFGSYYDIGIDAVSALPGCTGTPVAGTTTSTPTTACLGGSVDLGLSGNALAGALQYAWQSSTDAGVTWTTFANTTSPTQTVAVNGTTQYRAVVTCINGMASDTSAPVTVTVSSVAYYAPLPYLQDFELWDDLCANQDRPDTNWTNSPATGENSWRRNDEGSTAAWSFPGGGVYSPAAASGTYSARFHNYGATAPGTLNMLLNCSTAPGVSELSFSYMMGWYWYADTIKVRISTDGGANFTNLATFGPGQNGPEWRDTILNFTSSSAQTVIQFIGQPDQFGSYYDMGIDGVSVLPGCSGTPVAGTATATPGTVCPGQNVSLGLTGNVLAGTLSYTWQTSNNGGTTWATIGTSNNPSFTTSAFANASYRAVVTCLNGLASDTSASVSITAAPSVTYAPLPYTQDFESWMDRCDDQDIPDSNWINSPSTGENSWRRDDEGSTANWSWTFGGAYTPSAVSGAYSARFHNYGAGGGAAGPGSLNMLLDCSASPGINQLDFSYMLGYYYYYDSIKVRVSTDGGASFTTLATYGGNLNGPEWINSTLNFNSTSAQTVVQFMGMPDPGFSYYDGGIDGVSVIPGCNGTPTAGVVFADPACSGQDFELSLQGASVAAGLSYIWQKSATGTGGWTNMGSTATTATDNITATSYYRAILTCANSSLSDTTPVLQVDLAPFYYCYCASYSQPFTWSSNSNVGNVTMTTLPAGATLINNGTATPLINNATATETYSDFQVSLATSNIYRDSTYTLSITSNTEYYTYQNTRIAAWIDYNRNGVFEASEKLMDQQAPATTQNVSTVFTVPTGADLGYTGLRIIADASGATVVDPCGTYSLGETEDYLLNIILPPCSGTPDAGTAIITGDTATCVNYPISLTDTTHTYLQSGLTWHWQQSVNSGATWNYMPGSAMKDTLNNITVTGPAKYRFVIVCGNTGDTSYSNPLTVTINPPYACICLSMATGGNNPNPNAPVYGNNDSSDISSFKVGNFLMNTGGPVLLNPESIRPRTNYTYLQENELFTNNTYAVQVYHTLRSGTFAPARVTVFMDFNNNNVYDIPAERVFTSASYMPNGWMVMGNTSMIPNNAVKNVITGMRVILNNDVNPNSPSDDACGAYTSGETEDYVVTFRAGVLGVGSNAGIISQANVFPNPTDGRFSLDISSTKALGQVKVTVSSLTGQTILMNEYDAGSSTSFQAALNLSGQARGMYLVTIDAAGDRSLRKIVLE